MYKGTVDITHRDGTIETLRYSVNDAATKVDILISERWWRMSSSKKRVFVANHDGGCFWGEIVNTTAGKQVVFSHNGHVYADESPIAAFAHMVKGEL